MNFPWLEYEKWCITSWYTVKPDFCPILPDFSGKNRIPDPKNRIPDPEIFCFKTYLVYGEYYPKISAKSVKLNNTLKSGFFRISGKTGSRIQNFLAKNQPLTKMELTKKSLAKLVQPFRRKLQAHMLTHKHLVALV